MAIVDMPLEQLKCYMGINPKPHDFDLYWKTALEEMKAVHPNIQITPASFKCNFADCFDLYFTGVRNARIYAKLIKPKNITKPCPAVLEFHGYSGSSGDWFDKLAFAAQGFIVVSMDCRGQGGRSSDTGIDTGNTLIGHMVRGIDDKPENLLFRQIFLDTAQLAMLVMSMDDVDENRIAAFGASQGGGLTLACASLIPDIKKAVPIFPFLSDYKRAWDLDLNTTPYDEMRQYFKRFDPFHEREEDFFTRLGYIDIQHLVERIQGEILMPVTLRDDICPPSTQFAAYNKITSSKQLSIFHDFGHEHLPLVRDMVFQFLSNL